jgi:hypothetical protein
MTEPFESSLRKIARAETHLADLKRKVRAICQPNLYERFSEPDPEMPGWTVHKVRLSRQVPGDFSEIAGDIVDNLRAALDHAVYAVAAAGGCAHPKHAYFPFARDRNDLEAKLKGRCKDVPEEIWPLFRKLKPYRGGNGALWALNLVCGTNKHAILIPGLAAVICGGMNVEGIGEIRLIQNPVWDSAKQEMKLFSLGSQAQFRGDFQIGFAVAFGDVEGLAGKTAIPVLDTFVEVVKITTRKIEAAARSLGIVRACAS